MSDVANDARPRTARDALRRSVVTLERLDCPSPRPPSDVALVGCTGLVRAGWTLVDQFESNGRRYIVAYQNDYAEPNVERLSARERQVAEYLVLGHRYKIIAYELGISYSTVRVLVTRIAQKLGTRSGRELAQTLDRVKARLATSAS